MGLLESMKRDAEAITGNKEEFAQDIIFTSRSGPVVTVQGINTRHYLGFNLEAAQEVNMLKAHVVVSEQKLIDAGYPVRENGEVSMIDDRITATDNVTGEVITYVILQHYPNDAVGTISFILGKYEA